MKKDTKGTILTEAFKLFATNTYEQVTFDKLEVNTGLTRGAIMYHYKTKELIFKAMCDKFLLDEGALYEKLDSQVNKDTLLKDFIDIYIRTIEDRKESYLKLGVKNVHKAFINITNQATWFYPSFEVKASKWQFMQTQLWKEILTRSVKRNEIKKDFDLTTLADLFVNVYWGIAYEAIVYPDGIEVEKLKKSYELMYLTIKN